MDSPNAPKIVNLSSLSGAFERSHGERFASRHYPLSQGLGARKLGFNVTEVPPGKVGFPYHFHHVNEELFLILEGEGTLRWSGGRQALKTGDLICCPPGKDGVHQILNTGSSVLRYLALSTSEDPEVVEYPDSGKYGVIAGRPKGGRIQDAALAAFAFKERAVDYWDGEDGGHD